ncbi:MAG TPA: putative toxin-antitoxin system toxin component, PIN family [Bryobacteraceae bacterium]|jgi:putative PIN family toxin of toxin-antitoxin system
MSVTLDTNIYVSALNYSGMPFRLLEMARAGVVRIDISDAIEREILRILRDDFHWDGHRINDLAQRLSKFTNRVTPTETVRVVDDPDDDRIVECALAGGSTHIISRDKALLRLGEYRGIRISNDRDYLELARQR